MSGMRGAWVAVAVVVATVAGMVGIASAPPARAAAPVVPGDTQAGYVVYDRTTRQVVAQASQHRQFRSASLVKLLIALDYLQTKGSTAAVPPADLKLLQSMLRSSDDDAASTLWVRGGYEQVIKRMVPKLGLVDTLPPTDRRYWGYTALSAADVVTTYNYLLDRAPATFRDLIVGNLEQFTQCAADGFNQAFGLPRAVTGPKGVKQGWSGYGAGPTGPACVEGRDDVPPTPDTAKAPEEAPQADADTRPATLATPALDLSSRAMHTSGLVDGRRRVMVVLTLSPRTKSWDAQAATITGIARGLHDDATTTPAPTASPVDTYASRNGLGTPTSAEYAVPGGRARDYRAGTVYHSTATGAHLVGGTILARYRQLGGPGGALGLPTTDELPTADGRGRRSEFAGSGGAALVWNPAVNAARVVSGVSYTRYRALGETTSVLAYPAGDTTPTADGRGQITPFTGTGGATLVYHPTKAQAYAVYGSIRARWVQLGAERSSLGLPTSDEYAVPGGRRSDFDRGSVTWTARTGATSVR